MQYALLIYGTESAEETPEDLMAEEMAAYNVFTKHIAERGAFRAGEALYPSATATTVRVQDGRTITTDGPFAETKEVLGGFYIVEAADLDEAIGYAALIPGAKRGSIEVRPIVDFGDQSTQVIAQAAAPG
ncbi:MAG: YciI family protein [Chloroflexota bacterium]